MATDDLRAFIEARLADDDQETERLRLAGFNTARALREVAAKRALLAKTLRQIDRGWRPNHAISTLGYDGSAGWYGIYIWEYLYLVAPRLAELRDSVVPTV